MVTGSGVSLQDAIRHMLAKAQTLATKASREMGKTSGYLAVVLADKRTPRLDLMARIARACGYDLLLVGHGEALVLEPEPCGDSPLTVRRGYRVESGKGGALVLTPDGGRFSQGE